MRNEIEKLAIWYIPAFLIATLAASAMSDILPHLLESGSLGVGKTISFVFFVANAIQYIDNLVVAIWLYIQLKNQNGKKWAWLLFGAIAHLFAVIIFVVLMLYENQNASNKAIKTDG